MDIYPVIIEERTCFASSYWFAETEESLKALVLRTNPSRTYQITTDFKYTPIPNFKLSNLDNIESPSDALLAVPPFATLYKFHNVLVSDLYALLGKKCFLVYINVDTAKWTPLPA